MARRVSPFTKERGIAASWTCLWSIRKSSGVLRSRLRQLLNSLRKVGAKRRRCMFCLRQPGCESRRQTKHITNHGRTIEVRQQVERDTPRIITCLKTNAAYRDVDLHPDVAEFLQRYIGDKPGLLFHRLHRDLKLKFSKK